MKDRETATEDIKALVRAVMNEALADELRDKPQATGKEIETRVDFLIGRGIRATKRRGDALNYRRIYHATRWLLQTEMMEEDE